MYNYLQLILFASQFRIKEKNDDQTKGMTRRSSWDTATSVRSCWSWLSPSVNRLNNCVEVKNCNRFYEWTYTRVRVNFIVNKVYFSLSAWAQSNSYRRPWNHPHLPGSPAASVWMWEKTTPHWSMWFTQKTETRENMVVFRQMIEKYV